MRKEKILESLNRGDRVFVGSTNAEVFMDFRNHPVVITVNGETRNLRDEEDAFVLGEPPLSL